MTLLYSVGPLFFSVFFFNRYEYFSSVEITQNGVVFRAPFSKKRIFLYEELEEFGMDYGWLQGSRWTWIYFCKKPFDRKYRHNIIKMPFTKDCMRVAYSEKIYREMYDKAPKEIKKRLPMPWHEDSKLEKLYPQKEHVFCIGKTHIHKSKKNAGNPVKTEFSGAAQPVSSGTEALWKNKRFSADPYGRILFFAVGLFALVPGIILSLTEWKDYITGRAVSSNLLPYLYWGMILCMAVRAFIRRRLYFSTVEITDDGFILRAPFSEKCVFAYKELEEFGADFSLWGSGRKYWLYFSKTPFDRDYRHIISAMPFTEEQMRVRYSEKFYSAMCAAAPEEIKRILPASWKNGSLHKKKHSSQDHAFICRKKENTPLDVLDFELLTETE